MERDEIIKRVRELVVQRYIFPEVGAALDKVLAGRDYDAGDLPSFAAAVTEDLQSINGDKHLRLLYHAEELLDAPTDDAREHAELTRWSAKTSGGMARVARLPGNVGYLDIRPVLFPPEIAGGSACAALNLVAGTDVLLIDLRGCLGGAPTMVALVCGYLFGDEPVHLIDLYSREGDTLQQFWSQAYVPGPRYGRDKPIFVLTSGRTFSGGEDLSYDLQQAGRATLVGERTRGGAHPREGFRVHPHLEATIPVARAVHPISGTNWEGVGVVPEVEVPAADAPRTAYRLALEYVLATGTPSADEVGDALADLDRDGVLPC